MPEPPAYIFQSLACTICDNFVGMAIGGPPHRFEQAAKVIKANGPFYGRLPEKHKLPCRGLEQVYLCVKY